MQYKFERYTGNVPRGDTRIAINRSGLIRLSSGFCRASNVLTFKYTVLFYDKINNAIAFKFTNHKEEGVLRITKDRAAATLAATSFIKLNGLNLRSYFKRYDWEKQNVPDIGEVFIINLRVK